MSEEPTSSAPEATARARERARRVAFGLLLVAALGAAFWLRGSRKSGDYATRSFRAMEDLRACFAAFRASADSPREALLFGPADDKPFERCRSSFDEARKNALALRDAKAKRDRDAAASLASELDALVGFQFGETARGLVEQNVDVDATYESVESAWKLACRAASLENDDFTRSCIPAPTPAPPERAIPTPRVAFEVSTQEKPMSIAWRAIAQKKTVTLVAALREPDASSFVAYVAVSSDDGEKFSIGSVHGPPARPAPVDPPTLISDEPGKMPRYLLALQRAEDGLAHGVVARRNAGGDGLELVGALPDLPRELPPIRSGSPLVEVTNGKLASLALVLAAEKPRKAGDTELSGAIFYLGANNKVVSTPGLRPLAAIANPTPRVLVADQNGVALYSIPPPGKPWPKADTRPLAKSAELIAVSRGEERCGIENDELVPFVASAGPNAALFAIGEDKFYTLPFEHPADDELDLVCGSCPAAALARGPGRLSLLLPIADKISALALPVPTAYFEPNIFHSARSACAKGRTGVAFIRDDSVLYTEAEMGRWKFSKPVVLAEPNPDGVPSEVALIGTERSIVALWRRVPKDGSRVRIELVANDGSGWR